MSSKPLKTNGYRLNKYFSLLLMLSVSLASAEVRSSNIDLPYLSNSKFQQCLNRLQNSKKFRGVTASTFQRYRPTSPDPEVIKSLNYQPEFQKDVWDYLSVLVDQERVQDGIRSKQQWAGVLDRIEARYGVKSEHVLGVWGVESNFGQTLGKKSLLTSLATLSCFDRRQSYFRGEYASALKIIQNGDVTAYDMKGSWAGAFGQTQFMPSTYRQLAVDFDGDGRKDLVNSVPDALASTARFLVNRGYRKGEPWGYEVKMPEGYWGSSSRKNKKSMSYWRDKGFTLADGRALPYNLSYAGLLLPAGNGGPAFLVGKNFDTFYSYNASESYALGIAQLATLIEQGNTHNVSFVTAWPTNDPGISRRQAREIQQALINKGYEIGAVDGLIGNATRSAIKQYQRSHGIYPVDGRAGQKLHMVITNGGQYSANLSLQQSSKRSGYQQNMIESLGRHTGDRPSFNRYTSENTSHNYNSNINTTSNKDTLLTLSQELDIRKGTRAKNTEIIQQSLMTTEQAKANNTSYTINTSDSYGNSGYSTKNESVNNITNFASANLNPVSNNSEGQSESLIIEDEDGKYKLITDKFGNSIYVPVTD